MIKVNELRVGNLFQVPTIKHKAYGKILSIYQNGELTDLEYDCEAYSLKGALTPAFIKELIAITLTPEILEKCGFVLKKDTHFIQIEFNNHVVVFITDYEGNFSPRNKVKSVHQLQNLYFALTGEELNVQL